MKNDYLKLRTAPVLVNFFKLLLAASIFSLLIFNLLASQLVSPLYLQLVREEKQAAVSFLQKIRELPSFRSYLEMGKSIYGESLQDEVYLDQRRNKQKIDELEEVLGKNPQARDVLYNLYLLYHQDGNQTKAKEYLRRAREVDPMIR